MRKALIAGVLAATTLGATIGAAAPAAEAQPYWGYHHRYWGPRPYWRPYAYGYGPYWHGPYWHGPYWRHPHWGPRGCYYGYRCW